MNANELSAYLADKATDVAEFLFPQGKKSSGEWCVGSVAGEPGKSLKIRLTGSKRGMWKDFNAGDGGDLIDLWGAKRCISVVEAMREIKAHFGLRDDEPLRKAKHDYKRPAKPKGRTAQEGALDWLMGRGITAPTIEQFKIVEQMHGGITYAVFPYLRDGEYINGKYRNIADKKDMRQESGAEPCLFGWHLIDPKCRRVAICEGEIDAMTLHQLGYPALSVNAGAGNHQWLDNDFERLERFSEILLCYDADEAGQAGVREVAKRLGLNRCKIVTFGDHKDANEALQAEVEPSQFAHWIACAKTFDPEELRQLADFWDEVVASFWPAPGQEHPYPILKFPGGTQDWFEFRPGEVTVWTGYNGHGKSMLLNQVMIGLLKQEQRMCVFSGEMMPVEQGRRMAKQLTGLDRASPAYLKEAKNWITDRAWIFNLADSANLGRLLEVFEYGYKRYGIQHFVIDSLMMLDVPEDGPGAMSAQKDAMRRIGSFVRSTHTHIHLVAHPRKGNDEKKAPGKLDVAGSSKLTDGADNVFVVWADHKEDGERQDEPDGLLELHKQRNGSVQNKKLWLYYNKACQQFSTDKHRRPYKYIDFLEQREYA